MEGLKLEHLGWRTDYLRKIEVGTMHLIGENRDI